MERSTQRGKDQSEDWVIDRVLDGLTSEMFRSCTRRPSGRKGRDRLLPPELTALLVVLMGFFRRVSYVNLMEKFLGTSLTRRWWHEAPPSSAALTKARDRIGLRPLVELFRVLAARLLRMNRGMVCHGRQVFALDGSSFSVPDTIENRRHFGLPGSSRGRAGYPQIHVACLVQVGTRFVVDLAHGRYRTHELTLARKLFPAIRKGSLVIMDRLFLAFDFLWDMHRETRCDFIVRVRRGTRPRLVQRLSPSDAIVDVDLPRPYRRHRPDMPRVWRLRMISYRPAGGGVTIRLLTTMMDGAIGKREIANLYHDRWEVETMLDELQTHMADCSTVNRPVVLRSRNPMRVKQELFGMFIAYNAVRGVMADIADDNGVAPTRLSFVGTLERLREYLREAVLDPEMTPQRRSHLMRLAILRTQSPKRPDRHYPRAVKVKMSGYPLKRNVA